jgi:diadenosine tetraphosphate (Ap4A) HIT family hydrolase
MKIPDCEFCAEFSQPSGSRFGSLYAGIIPNRIVEQSNGVAVLPTLGQLFPGSLLILPIAHFETVASMPRTGRAFCLEMATKYVDRLHGYGTPVIFEHGARRGSGRSCGIYHAHIHVVPVPDTLSINELLPGAHTDAETLEGAYDQLQSEDSYLLARDSDGRLGFVTGKDAGSDRFPSQYLRRYLQSRFKLDTPWDWRDYARPESHLLETVRALDRSHVAVGN